MDMLADEIKKFYAMKETFDVFKLRDVQNVAIILDFAAVHGYTVEDFHMFNQLLPLMNSLGEIQYFHPFPNIEHAKAIKQFEKDLPKELRIQLRKLRMRSIVLNNVTNRRP